jgi:hypothetical protein
MYVVKSKVEKNIIALIRNIHLIFEGIKLTYKERKMQGE